ncbi:MAG TPA: tRNA uridine-5-carboxymethylaminomethyl(34) synthesis GTPase MnmE [Vicinamibacterales bacterium]|nr:tRNA uridine-5-carboxymethylaminomethyl(34) synthesis GTPase MnmE [Vicinamibacterales bacterium]
MGALFSTADTIVAIATPPGHSGLGVVRVSGPEAVAIAQQLTNRRTPFEPRYATLTKVPGVDQVIVTWFASPHSYTGEDVIEVSGHGSPWVLQTILELACNAGARLAQPGEFTLRAYLNGHLDLVQAEAVADLIEAVTPLQARVAFDQLEGTLTGAVRTIDAQLFELVAKLEASLDFPDEGFHFITRNVATAELEGVREELARLVGDGRRGRLIREGRLVVIAGRPNVGKSSLFNALVGTNRAIVTPLAGTTRDLLTEQLDVCGVPITLVDTAGLRTSTDVIEEEGVKRAERAREGAALTLLVLDKSQPLDEDDRRLLGGTNGAQLVIANKADLESAWASDAVTDSGGGAALDVSAVTGAGLDAMRTAIVTALSGASGEDWRDPPRLSNLRHLQQVERALVAVERSLDGLREGATEELVLAELSDARTALESLTRTRSSDDLLVHIFSRFCIGK